VNDPFFKRAQCNIKRGGDACLVRPGLRLTVVDRQVLVAQVGQQALIRRVEIPARLVPCHEFGGERVGFV